MDRDKLRKFVEDPDWPMMVELVMGHLEPLRDIMTVDGSMSNDQIASEVRGRQISIARMEAFLRDAGFAGSKITSNSETTFR